MSTWLAYLDFSHCVLKIMVQKDQEMGGCAYFPFMQLCGAISDLLRTHSIRFMAFSISKHVPAGNVWSFQPRSSLFIDCTQAGTHSPGSYPMIISGVSPPNLKESENPTEISGGTPTPTVFKSSSGSISIFRKKRFNLPTWRMWSLRSGATGTLAFFWPLYLRAWKKLMNNEHAWTAEPRHMIREIMRSHYVPWRCFHLWWILWADLGEIVRRDFHGMATGTATHGFETLGQTLSSYPAKITAN